MGTITLEVYGQSVKIITDDPYFMRCTHEFCRSMIKYKMERVVDPNSNGYHAKMMRVPDCTFAASPLNRSFYCIHRGQKDEFLHYLTRCGVKPEEIKVIDVPFYEPTKAEIAIKDGWVPKENQAPVVEYILEDDPLRILPVQTGFGKAVDVETPIRVPGGWKRMGDLVVGDVVTGADGKPTMVTAVYPQPIKSVFELTLIDGRTVRACAEHLWKAYTPGRGWGVRDTDVLMGLLEGGEAVYLPPVQLEHGSENGTLLKQYTHGQTSGSIPFHNDDELTHIRELVWSNGGVATVNGNYVVYWFPDGIQVVSIVEKEPTLTQCISVDNADRLYVCGNYIATHNTFLALYSAYKMGVRWMLVTRGGYVDKWVEDVEKTYNIPRDRIIVIKGEKALLKAIDKAKQGEFDFDVILMSTGGYSDYIKHYEQYLGTELGDMYMDPRALGMLFGVGLRVVDEAHQMLHAYYRIDLYSHYPKVLFLSATILGNDALEKRVHEIIYPANKRYNGAEWKCYIHATGLKYNLAEPSKARFTDHRKNYSHVIFEQYLMRNKEKLKHYLNMIANLTSDFLKKRKPGQKYLIFASTVDMCDLIVKDLKSRKYSGVIVGRYVAEDNLEDIYGYDIIVTTPGSGGTGIDIPDLATALSTSAISSGKLNIQMLGRLRELKNYPGEEPEYQYLICADIPKQLDYHRQKLELFQGKVKSHKVQHTGALI